MMREKERVGWIERVALTYMHCCVSDRWLVGNCLIVQGARLNVLWWSREHGMKAQEGRIYEDLWLIHVVVLQKLTQHCKAIILRLSNKLPFLKWCSGKEPFCQCRRHKRQGFDPWVRKIPRRRKWQPAPVFLPGVSHGQRSQAGSSPWDCRVRHIWVAKHTQTI